MYVCMYVSDPDIVSVTCIQYVVHKLLMACSCWPQLLINLYYSIPWSCWIKNSYYSRSCYSAYAPGLDIKCDEDCQTLLNTYAAYLKFLNPPFSSGTHLQYSLIEKWICTVIPLSVTHVYVQYTLNGCTCCLQYSPIKYILLYTLICHTCVCSVYLKWTHMCFIQLDY